MRSPPLPCKIPPININRLLDFPLLQNMKLRTIPLALFPSLFLTILATAEPAKSYPKPATYQDTAEKKAERLLWFNDARFGMFIHWGLYSQLAGEWQDKHVDGGAEWIQKYLEIPSSQYSPLAKTFTGRDFNADTWVKAPGLARPPCVQRLRQGHTGQGKIPQLPLWPAR